jgi:hypothetical protein
MACNTVFRVGVTNNGLASPTDEERDVVEATVVAWRNAVFNGDFGIPRMEFTEVPALIDIEVRFDQTGLDPGEWCGASAGVGIYKLGLIAGCDFDPSDLTYASLHELSERTVTGFDTKLPDLPEIAALCPSVDEKPNSFRPTKPCEWERQEILDRASVRPLGFPIDYDSFLVDGVNLTASASTIEVGETVSLTLETIRGEYEFAFDPELEDDIPVRSDVVVTHPASWTISGPGRWVSGPSNTSGTIEADSAGTIVVTATAGPGSDVIYPWPSAEVTISVSDPGGGDPQGPDPNDVATVQVSPGLVSLSQSNPSAQLTATALDSGGNPMFGIVFTWTSSDTEVAQVSSLSENVANVDGCWVGPGTKRATITATVVGASPAKTGIAQARVTNAAC